MGSECRAGSVSEDCFTPRSRLFDRHGTNWIRLIGLALSQDRPPCLSHTTCQSVVKQDSSRGGGKRAIDREVHRNRDRQRDREGERHTEHTQVDRETDRERRAQRPRATGEKKKEDGEIKQETREI